MDGIDRVHVDACMHVVVLLQVHSLILSEGLPACVRALGAATPHPEGEGLATHTHTPHYTRFSYPNTPNPPFNTPLPFD